MADTFMVFFVILIQCFVVINVFYLFVFGIISTEDNGNYWKKFLKLPL